jgi:hypothetical protein
VELRKKISQAEELLGHTQIDTPEQMKHQKRLNYLLTQLHTLRPDRACSPLLSDGYRDSLIKKMS